MSSDFVWECIAAFLRWAHVFSAILWIGQTFLFHRIEKNLTALASGGEDIEGQAWMVHGGGYFYVQKQRMTQDVPRDLMWFKWESAATWISGALLLIVVYYQGGLILDPTRSGWLESGPTFWEATAAGVGVIIAGWIVYDLLARSPLRKYDAGFAVVGWLLTVGVAYWLSSVLSARAAYIHVGATLGTIMAANVWVIILPAQRKMLEAARAGDEIDFSLASAGPLRSRHNSYIVLPLLFIMISNHYPTISYGYTHAWLSLGIILLVGWFAAWLLLRDWS